MDGLKHDNYADVGILSAMVECVPASKHTLFAAALVGRDLMRGPWWLRSLAGTVGWVRGWERTTTWFLLLTQIERGMASDIVSDFSSHIVTGKDQSDRRSVGGLNQEEIGVTLMLLRNLLSGVELHPLYQSVLNPTPAPRAEP